MAKWQAAARNGAAICCNLAGPGAGAGGPALAAAPRNLVWCVELPNTCPASCKASCKLPAASLALSCCSLGPPPSLMLPPQTFVPQVSHDLRELAPLVDAAWEMRPGGRLEASSPDRLPML